MTNIEEETRKHIAEFLPDAIMTALLSYQMFAEHEASDEAKEFTAHHNACKVAIAHIELLIKLARWADIEPPSIDDEDHNKILQTMIENAQRDVTQYQTEQNKEEDTE